MKKLWNSMELFSHVARSRPSSFPRLLSRFYGAFNNDTIIDKPSQIPSSQCTIKEKSQLDEAFDSAEETTEQIIIKAFRDMEVGKAFNERDLGLVSLKIGVRLDGKGEDPEKALPFANIALKLLDKDPKYPSLHVAMTLQLLGSLNYRLKRFSDSLRYINMANRVLGRLQDEGVSVDKASYALYRVPLQLAYVNNTVTGCVEEASEDLNMNMKLGHIKVKRNFADEYVVALNFKEALPNCLKALEIQKEHFVKIQPEDVVHPVQVARDRRLLGILCSGLEECEKALEQNVLVHRILKNWNLSDLLQSEIDAANRIICLRRYDEALGILKNVVQQTDKDSGKRALVLISMAKLLYELEKYAYCKRCLEISLGILHKSKRISPLEVAEAITEISRQYVTMKEFEDCKRRLQTCLRRMILRKGKRLSPMEVAETYSEISMQYETMNEFLTAI